MQIKRCFLVVDDIKKCLLEQAFAFGFSLIEIPWTSVDALIFLSSSDILMFELVSRNLACYS